MSRLNNANDQRLQQSLDHLQQATDSMRSAQQAASQGGEQGSAQAQANARKAADALKESQDLLTGARRQEASNQLGGLSQRADGIAAQQRDFEKRLRQAFGDQINGANPGAGGPAAAAARQKASKELADEKDKMAGEVAQLEKDMQKAARDMAGTQPAATGRVRDGLSTLQGDEVKSRTEFSARYIRQGLGGYMVNREAPITEALDKVAQDLKAAQGALGQGKGQGSNDAERSLSQVERLRAQLEQMSGKQPGGQQGGQQQGNQPGGQQAGQQAGQQGGQQGGPTGRPARGPTGRPARGPTGWWTAERQQSAGWGPERGPVPALRTAWKRERRRRAVGQSIQQRAIRSGGDFRA